MLRFPRNTKTTLLPLLSALLAPTLVLLSACGRTEGNSKLARARSDVESLSRALLRYQAQYKALPVVDSSTSVQPQDTVIGILATNASPAILDRYNSNRIGFLSVPASSLDAGKFVDPWGHEYNIAVDISGRGLVAVRARDVMGPVAVWSSGPNGLNEYGQGDDVCSWKK